jgi:tRNA G18 (ribose-2'-O)-methylase SpoU
MKNTRNIPPSGQKDFHFLPKILKQDKYKETEKLPLILILDNLRSAFNVGSIIRTAECLNIEEIWFCGYTPNPEHPKIANTAMGTQERIIWKSFSDVKDAVIKAKELGYKVYALETVENAESVFEQDYNGNIAFIVGNEALGIAVDVIVLCDKCILLPVLGWKNSLNVATACAIACFEVLRQRSFL